MPRLTPDQLRQLLDSSEGEDLDFKRDQYALKGGGEYARGELLKDILAFANTKRTRDAFIVIGVRDEPPNKAVAVGVIDHPNDADLQELVNKRTNRPVRFRYEVVAFESAQIGVIIISSEQQTPIYAVNDLGVVKQNAVYARHGSSTRQLTPDEVLSATAVPTRPIPSNSIAHQDLKVLATRWLSVFDGHGLKRTQIPSVLGRPDLSVAHFDNWQNVAGILNGDLVDKVVRMFRIDRAWLEGTSDRPYHPIYPNRDLGDLLDSMLQLRKGHTSVTLVGLKTGKRGPEEDPFQHVGFLLKTDVIGVDRPSSLSSFGAIYDMPMHNWYDGVARWRCKQIILAARFFDFMFDGYQVSRTQLESLCSGHEFPFLTLEKGFCGSWHPDDFVFPKGRSARAKEVDDFEEFIECFKKNGFVDRLREMRRLVPGVEGADPKLYFDGPASY